VGEAALENNSSGDRNVAVGFEALQDNTTGDDNVAVGSLALTVNTSGINNTAVGQRALEGNTTGNRNVALGNLAGSDVTTGSNNVYIGNGAGDGNPLALTGSNNTVIGYLANPSAVGISDEITLGNSSVTTLRCQVTTITSLSDARDKTDVVDLDAGLSFLNALRPVRFTWNMRDGGKVGDADTGFIAQDLQKAMSCAGVDIPGLVYDVNPDRLEAGYGKLLPVLVRAIQELSAEVAVLKAEMGLT
jgi:hypothetical protein